LHDGFGPPRTQCYGEEANGLPIQTDFVKSGATDSALLLAACPIPVLRNQEGELINIGPVLLRSRPYRLDARAGRRFSALGQS